MDTSDDTAEIRQAQYARQYTHDTLIIHIHDTRAEIQMHTSLIHDPKYAIEIRTLIRAQYARGYAEVIHNQIHD